MSRNILEEIAERTRERIEAERRSTPLAEVRRQAEAKRSEAVPHRFYDALKKTGMAFICEVKKASPSKGLIAESFPYLDIAKEYEQAGAEAISCLTEPYYFQGKDAYLEEITQTVQLPVLRKDFTIDEYMVFQAGSLMASAVLLICSILDDSQIHDFRQLAEELGMDALVEAHDEQEIERAMRAGARIIGVNNRNLKDFSVDNGNSIRLRRLVPKDIAFVSESGIQSRQDIERLQGSGVDAVLIGETLMRAPDKQAKLRELRGQDH